MRGPQDPQHPPHSRRRAGARARGPWPAGGPGPAGSSSGHAPPSGSHRIDAAVERDHRQAAPTANKNHSIAPFPSHSSLVRGRRDGSDADVCLALVSLTVQDTEHIPNLGMAGERSLEAPTRLDDTTSTAGGARTNTVAAIGTRATAMALNVAISLRTRPTAGQVGPSRCSALRRIVRDARRVAVSASYGPRRQPWCRLVVSRAWWRRRQCRGPSATAGPISRRGSGRGRRRSGR
jgi:hypothetical protein